MSLHHHHQADRVVAFVRPHSVPVLQPRGRQEAPAGDDHVTADAYRRFLRRTQDVGATGPAYPGGISALIQDRETVTMLLVRLLQRQ